MTDLFRIIANSLKEPRFYIEVRQFKLRKLFVLSLIPILLMTLNSYLNLQPMVANIQNQIYQVGQYVPDFNYEQGYLAISESDKPLYYQSDDVQIVIDPSLKSNPLFHNIPMSQEKFQRIDATKRFQLYLLYDQAYLSLDQSAYDLTDPAKTFVNRAHFLKLLENFKASSLIFKTVVGVTSFLYAVLAYAIMLTLLTLMAKIFNRFLNHPLGFRPRLKIMIAITLVPLILFELLKMIWPALNLPLFIFVPFILFIYFQSFKDYTELVQGFIKVSQKIQAEQEKLETDLRKEDDDFNQLKLKQEQVQQEYRTIYQKHKRSQSQQEKNTLKTQMQQLEIELIQLEIQIQEYVNQYKKDHPDQQDDQ
ncbi:DUF1189 family protein [Ignavigranum ruoffiae]|uniref:DUF1189 family protein n=1 Tax=Ignavigranum ruoffiae TaxID=89093 RepID=UPI0023537286|nr:DUF1189 family protein [Ignavigranum ruoffiae]